jgi:hypothetical protein
MADRKATKEEWDAILDRQSGRKPKVFASASCHICGRIIREGAWGSRSSNLKKHLTACDRKRKEMEAKNANK